MFHIARASDLIQQGFNTRALASQIAQINKETWERITLPKYIWTEEIILEQFHYCPDLIYLALDDKKNIVASTTMLLTTLDRAMNCTSWEDISGKRTLSTHDPNGDTVFGIDLTVHPDYQALGLSERLINTAFLITVVGGQKKGALLGARVPAYKKYAHHRSIEEHVFGENNSGKTRDPEIRLYISDGFHPIRIIPNYMDDEESLNYGVLMMFDNPFVDILDTNQASTLQALATSFMI